MNYYHKDHCLQIKNCAEILQSFYITISTTIFSTLFSKFKHLQSRVTNRSKYSVYLDQPGNSGTVFHFYSTGLSINCTFEDHNNCGYRQIFIGSFYHWVRFPADDYNLLPDFDKTLGDKTGNKNVLNISSTIR